VRIPEDNLIELKSLVTAQARGLMMVDDDDTPDENPQKSAFGFMSPLLGVGSSLVTSGSAGRSGKISSGAALPDTIILVGYTGERGF
jgi:hypothetical protein